MVEALISPKAGLVDRRNGGGYADRDVDSLPASAAAPRSDSRSSSKSARARRSFPQRRCWP